MPWKAMQGDISMSAIAIPADPTGSGTPRPRITRQPQVAALTTAVAACLVLWAFATHGLAPATFGLSTSLVLAGGCMAAAIVAYGFPIYIRHNTKICVTTVPIFVLAALAPPGLVGIAAWLAVLAGEIVVIGKRVTQATDAATMAARWSGIALVTSVLAHIDIGAAWESSPIAMALPYIAAAVFMWATDLATLPLALIPASGERYGQIVGTAARDGAIPEGVQYLVALAGVLAAVHEVWTLALLIVPIGLIYLTFQKEMDPDTFHLLRDMADHIDLRGSYTKGHSDRVQELVAGILAELGMHGQEARQIITAARLHDLGKIGLPDQLLISSGALSPEEQDLLESYPSRGAELMKAYPDFARGLEMVRHHHERWDGTGYPDRLSGTDIPFGARVIAVADSFDAMTSERPYRRALSIDQAAQILRGGAGRQWDPQIVDAFLASIDRTRARSIGPVGSESEGQGSLTSVIPGSAR
jgi:HD-GYP domain-containing protein (c-di-GMP phosphodiesterase class II)